MAVKAAYELPYTGEEVQEMLEQAVTNKGQIENLGAILDDKVDKVAGKDLSTNDYTDEEKAKLSSLENGAQKNVQSDWNAISGDAYIKNKPTIPTKVSELENDRGYTSNVGTITGIMMNGASKGTSGVINLGTVLTQHQDISGKADRADAIGSLTLSMNDTNYQITLSGTKVDGTPFTVSNVIDLPLESVVVSGSYNKSTKEVVLRLKDGSTIEFSVADLVSGLQSEITTTNKLSADLVQNGTTNKVLTAAEKTKLANIEEGAQQNVQADWNATSGDSFIKNKPTIPQGVTVDDALSATSENPVQNKVINSALGSKQNTLTFDTTPTANSNNPVTSAGIKAYVDNATPTMTMDDTPTSGSSNPVKSSGIYNALQGKQNTLTFDSTPTASSSNPVTSGGVKAALDLKANQSTTYTKTEVDGLLEDVAYLADDDGQATTLTFDPQADTVWNKAQTLSSAQQQQARENIGAAGINDVAGMQVVNHGTSDTTFSLTPNVLHIWGEVSALTLTLATPADATIVNEYMFQFTSGTTATTLSLPSTVTWVAAPSINAGATYQVSIVNNLGVIAKFTETA